MPNANVSIQVLPKADDQKKIIAIIDSAIDCIKKSKVTYEVGPMETTMEGDLDTLLDLVKKVQHLCITNGAKSLFTNIKIAYDPKGVMTIKQKIAKYRTK